MSFPARWSLFIPKALHRIGLGRPERLESDGGQSQDQGQPGGKQEESDLQVHAVGEALQPRTGGQVADGPGEGVGQQDPGQELPGLNPEDARDRESIFSKTLVLRSGRPSEPPVHSMFLAVKGGALDYAEKLQSGV